MRGKLIQAAAGLITAGLIPAYAGKTASNPSVALWNRAHPRVCGENHHDDKRVLPVVGSSPRMRGKHGRQARPQAKHGLIHAYAGKTAPVPTRIVSSTAHPRVCGENGLFFCGLCLAWGSSPRMRGKPYRESAERATYGLIPAYAGKTKDPRAAKRARPAHPRVCGENFDSHS